MRHLGIAIVDRLIGGRAFLGAAHLLAGAALLLAFLLLDVTLISPLLRDPVDALGAAAAAVALGIFLIASVGLVPALRPVQVAAVGSLLGVTFRTGLPGSARHLTDRLRSLAWLVLHLLVGGAAVLASGTALVLGADSVRAVVEGASLWRAAAGLGLLLVVPLPPALGAAALRAAAGPLLGPSQRERVGALERQAMELVERTRVAREIHDGIGHALSVVSLQASAARRVQDRDPAFVAGALEAIEDTSRAAAAELDHVLGLLRDHPQDRQPVLDLSALGELVVATRRAGLVIEVSTTGHRLTALPGVVSRELYRVVQEALANALRHGSGTCTLRVSVTAARVELTVGNPVGPRAGRGGGGRGLAGMAERVIALGGTLSSKAESGVWVVRAVLPLASVKEVS